MKHTPGPWEIEYDNSDDRSGGQWYEVGPARVCFGYGDDDPVHEANARLIAAAPELLGALTALLETLDDQEVFEEHDDPGEQGHDVERCSLCLARTAIAKATGEVNETTY